MGEFCTCPVLWSDYPKRIRFLELKSWNLLGSRITRPWLLGVETRGSRCMPDSHFDFLEAGSCQKQEKRKLTLADKTDLSFPFVKGAESNISFSHNIVKPSKLWVHSCNKPFVKALKIHRGKIPLLYCALLFPCGIISQPNNPTMESKILWKQLT